MSTPIATLSRFQKPLLLDSVTGITTLCLALLIEECRYLGIPIPVPFLMMITAVLLSASFRGLRAGLISASVWAAYVIYAAIAGFGPATLTGGFFQVSTGIAIVYIAAILQGIQKDRNTQLLKALKGAYRELDLRFEENTHELVHLEDQRRETAIALQRSQRQYQSLAEAAPVGIFRTDAIGNCIYVNEKWCALSGLSAEEAMGQGWVKALHPDDRSHIAQAWYDAAQNHTLFQAEYRFQRTDGRTTWMMGQAVAERDEIGTVVGYVGTITDISDRKQAEIALQESESFLQAIFERSGVGIVVTDLQQHFKFVKTNRAFQQMLGYSDAELRSLSVLDVTHEDDLAATHRLGSELFTNQSDRIVLEKRYYHRDGNILWARTTVSFMHDEAGQPKYGIGVIENVTERKLAEMALRASEERWQLAIAGNNDGIWDHNLMTNEHFLSDRCYEMLGYAPEEIDTFDKWLSYIHPDDLPLIRTAFQNHLERNTAYYTCEYRVRNAQSRYTWILARGKAMWDEAETPIRAIGSITDISDRKQAEELLKRTKEELEQRVIERTAELFEANHHLEQKLQERLMIEQMKNEFISIVSHELRTPLTSIYSALDLLADGIIPLDSDRGKRTIAIAAEGAERLTRLVNDILDLERLESGKLKLTLRSCALMDLVNQATALLQVMADRSGITLSIVPLDVCVFVDPDRIIQVFTNLLSNAIKFSPKASTIEISAKILSSEMLQITVRDEGRGIPADKLEKIFDRFHQVDASDARSNGGTGLGLAICRTIVEQHGGEIWVESVLGKRSAFHFTVSIAKTHSIN